MLFTIIAHTNSKHPRIEKDNEEILHVYVKELAKDGKANEAIIETLSEYLNTPKSFIELVQGAKSKTKLFTVYNE